MRRDPLISRFVVFAHFLCTKMFGSNFVRRGKHLLKRNSVLSDATRVISSHPAFGYCSFNGLSRIYAVLSQILMGIINASVFKRRELYVLTTQPRLAKKSQRCTIQWNDHSESAWGAMLSSTHLYDGCSRRKLIIVAWSAWSAMLNRSPSQETLTLQNMLCKQTTYLVSLFCHWLLWKQHWQSLNELTESWSAMLNIHLWSAMLNGDFSRSAMLNRRRLSIVGDLRIAKLGRLWDRTAFLQSVSFRALNWE